jgi:hypothetical protein
MSANEWTEPPSADAPHVHKPLSAFLVNHTDTLGMTWKEIDALRPPFIINGLLRRGEVMLMGAESKSRKSWLAQDAGFCVAIGIPWLPDVDGEHGFATKKARVHVLDLELSPGEMRFRFAKARGNRFANCPGDASEITKRFIAYSLDGLNVKDILPLLQELLKSVEPGDLVILDCLYRLVPDGNEVADVAAILEIVKRFASDSQAGVIVVDHFRKAGDEKARNRFAGSFVKQASASTLLAIEVIAGDILVLNIDARTFHGIPRVYARFNLENYSFNRLLEPEIEKSKQADSQAELVGWLTKLTENLPAGFAITATDAVDRWEITRQAATPRLRRLVAKNWLVESPAGNGKATKWSLTTEGIAAKGSRNDSNLHPDLHP